MRIASDQVTASTPTNPRTSDVQGKQRNSGNSNKRRHLYAFFTIALLFFILLFPDHPKDFTVEQFLQLPLEWPALILALLLVRGKLLSLVCTFIVFFLAVALLLRTADIGSRLAFDRRFSPLVELHLIGDGWNLASQQVGLIEASIFVVIATTLLIALFISLFYGLKAIANIQSKPRMVVGAAAAIVLSVGSLFLWTQSEDQKSSVVQARFVPEVIDRSRGMQRSIVDQQNFVAQLLVDPVSLATPPAFTALSGLDVSFIFIESYGQSFLFDEDLGPPATQRLLSIEDQISNAGLHVRSGWLTSPVRGGRSWLTHASFASGLEITNQARYDRLISSNRVSLYSLFSQAGWQSVGIVPAIRESWPEGAWYGFDKIYDFERMNYKGEAFGWVTMPDQFTLSSFERTIRQPAEIPVMTEIALISSHAPWTPIPYIVPWESVGDGAVFDGTRRFGEPMTWNNRTKVREMYAKSLDYSLATVGEYLERHGENAFLVIHGDHQPASIIAGWGKTADVPIHVVSANPQLLDRLPDDVFNPSMIPELNSTSLPMWSVRELFSRIFEDPLTPSVSTE